MTVLNITSEIWYIYILFSGVSFFTFVETVTRRSWIVMSKMYYVHVSILSFVRNRTMANIAFMYMLAKHFDICRHIYAGTAQYVTFTCMWLCE